jgi:hypothetical protein
LCRALLTKSDERPSNICHVRRAALAAAVAGLLLAAGAAASSRSAPLQHGESQGVTVDVYAPGRIVFVTNASANARSHLRGPQIAPGCVKARFTNGKWDAQDVFGPTTQFGPQLRLDLSSMQLRGGTAFQAPYDGCEIGGFYGHQWNDAWGTRDAVEIWLTASGRHFFNDRAAARDLAYFVRSERVHKIRISGNPRPGLEWFVHRYPRRVVKLPNSTARVPEHVIGFWIGARTIVFTTTSSTGRRFFVVAKHGSFKLPSKNLGDLAFVF